LQRHIVPGIMLTENTRNNANDGFGAEVSESGKALSRGGIKIRIFRDF
jgi:hypothetical protein